MRTLLFMLMLFPTLVKGQITKERPARIEYLAGSALPLGSFRAGENDNFIFGQAIDGGTVGVSMTFPFKKHMYLGGGSRIMLFALNNDITTNQVKERYNNPQYTNTGISNAFYELNIHCIGPEISWVIPIWVFEVEPGAKIGLAMINASSAASRIKIQRQNVDTKENELLHIGYARSGSSFSVFGNLGLKVGKKFARDMFSISAGMYYTTTSLKFNFKEERVDFYGNRQHIGNFTVHNSVNVLLFEAGVQFRLWRAENQLRH